MTKRIAIIASLIHPIRHKHLLEWYYGLSQIRKNTQLFLGSKDPRIPEAKNYKINSKKEKLKYAVINWSKFKKQRASYQKIQPLVSYRPEVIHLLTSNVFKNIEPLIQDPNIKLIVSFRGFDINVYPFQSEENKILTQRIFKRADVLHFVSKNLKATAISLGADSKKCIVINRSISVGPNDLFEGEKRISEPLLMVSVGRLVWEKGYLYALETVAILKTKGYRIEYKIAGNGRDMDMLRFHIERLGISEQVELLGELDSDSVQKLLARADIYFQPSLIEGIPNSIYEALYHRLPIVSSHIGGIPEVVEEGVTGFLSAPCDSMGYADNIIKLINDADLRRNMGMNGHNCIINSFSREKELEKWMEIYNGL